MKKQYKKLKALLPKSRGAAAKSEDALQKSGRYIKTPDNLLKAVFLYLTEGVSYGQTAARLQMTGAYPLTKNAAYEQMIGSVREQKADDVFQLCRMRWQMNCP